MNDIAGLEAERPAAVVARKIIGRKLVRLLAVLAQHADQALRHDYAHTRCDQKALDAHVDEAGDRTGRGIRVQRREYEMTRQRCMHTDMRCLPVAHFPDHDHIRIVS